MPAYVVVGVDVEDAEAYSAYTREVPATLEPYGGRFVVRGGAFEVLEDCGHMAPLERPRALAALLSAWIERHGL